MATISDLLAQMRQEPSRYPVVASEDTPMSSTQQLNPFILGESRGPNILAPAPEVQPTLTPLEEPPPQLEIPLNTPPDPIRILDQLANLPQAKPERPKTVQELQAERRATKTTPSLPEQSFIGSAALPIEAQLALANQGQRFDQSSLSNQLAIAQIRQRLQDEREDRQFIREKAEFERRRLARQDELDDQLKRQQLSQLEYENSPEFQVQRQISQLIETRNAMIKEFGMEPIFDQDGRIAEFRPIQGLQQNTPLKLGSAIDKATGDPIFFFRNNSNQIFVGDENGGGLREVNLAEIQPLIKEAQGGPLLQMLSSGNESTEPGTPEFDEQQAIAEFDDILSDKK